MKKVLQFAGVISLALAVIAFILMLATPAIVLSSGNSQYIYKGTVVLFGSKESANIAGLITLTSETKPSVLALIGFILIIVALVILLLGVILPLLKVKALEKFAGVLNLVAVAALVTAGILIFFTEPAFGAANEWSEESIKAWTLGGGYIAAGILSIVGGAIAILPAAIDFVGKKK